MPYPPKAVCLHLATLYSDYVHDQLHTLFHKPTSMVEVGQAQVSPGLMFAVMALSAKFSSHAFFKGASPRSRGGRYAEKAAQLLNSSAVYLESVQACILLRACKTIERDAARESVHYGMACCMAQLLDLPYRQCISRLKREVNLRGTRLLLASLSKCWQSQRGIRSA